MKEKIREKTSCLGLNTGSLELTFEVPTIYTKCYAVGPPLEENCKYYVISSTIKSIVLTSKYFNVSLCNFGLSPLLLKWNE